MHGISARSSSPSDTDVWKEMSMDYTRDEGIRQQSPVEELLLDISARLERMEELITPRSLSGTP